MTTTNVWNPCTTSSASTGACETTGASRRDDKATNTRDRWRKRVYALLLAALLLAGCTPEPRPIAYGEDVCVHCQMTAVDPRYGAELVTATGKTLVFDAVECMAAYVEANSGLDVHSLWVSDYREPGTLVRVDEAFFVQSDRLHSPMAMNVAAFRAAASPEAVRDSLGGTLLSWDEVRERARRMGSGAREHGPGHAMPSFDASLTSE